MVLVHAKEREVAKLFGALHLGVMRIGVSGRRTPDIVYYSVSVGVDRFSVPVANRRCEWLRSPRRAGVG